MGILDKLFKPSPEKLKARPEVDQLIDELIEIGQSEGFLTMPPDEGICGRCSSKVVKKGSMVKCSYCGLEQNLDHFDKSYKHIRAREIGMRLNKIGKKELMQAVYYEVHSATGMGPELNSAWAYIGDWLP